MIELEKKTIKELREYAISQNFDLISKKRDDILIEIQKFEIQKANTILNIPDVPINHFPVINSNYSEFEQKQTKRIQTKLKNSLNNFMSFSGFVLYVWNERNLNCRLIPLPRISNELRVNKSETFFLGQPSLVIDGKPLFIVVRGIPYSIKVELRNLVDLLKEYNFDDDILKKNLPDNVFNNPTLLVQEGYTSNDIDTYNNSLVANRIFRLQRLSPQTIILMCLLMLCSCLITFMLVSTYYQAIIENMKIK